MAPSPDPTHRRSHVPMNHVDQKEVTVCDWTEVIDDLTLRVAAHTERNTRTVV